MNKRNKHKYKKVSIDYIPSIKSIPTKVASCRFDNTSSGVWIIHSFSSWALVQMPRLWHINQVFCPKIFFIDYGFNSGLNMYIFWLAYWKKPKYFSVWWFTFSLLALVSLIFGLYLRHLVTTWRSDISQITFLILFFEFKRVFDTCSSFSDR